ncbi:MAG: DUF3467 domain-containing protein [Planctomycetota bacterium]
MSSDETPNSGQPTPESQTPPLRARVPDAIAAGTFSTGAIVMTGPSEFIVDFLQTLGRPHKVASRVVIPHSVMPQFIEALTTNLDLYRNRFGDPGTPTPPTPNPDARRPTPQEIYDDLKLPDEVLSGTYANGVMISHGATEFGLDFLTSFFPQSAVSSRVFVASGQVPRLLDSLKNAVRQLEQRRQGQLPPKPTDSPPNDPPVNPPSNENPTIDDPPPEDPPSES